jgi:hypothetical protein
MASNQEIDQLPDERCPDCGSGFAKDKAGMGFRRHLKQLPKLDPKTGKPLRDGQGNLIMCGGTSESWGKGNRSLGNFDFNELETAGKRMICRNCGKDTPHNLPSGLCQKCFEFQGSNVRKGCLYMVIVAVAIVGLIVILWKTLDISEFMISIFWLAILSFVAIVVYAIVRAVRMSPEESHESCYGLLNWEIVCAHCQTKGKVRTKNIEKDVGISGKKASAAALTGGISILATGLSRKETVTQAHCDNCGSTWTY